jgi:ATP-dependent Clp protease, protease subunit
MTQQNTQTLSYMPTVRVESPNGDTVIQDLVSAFSTKRVVFAHGPVNNQMAQAINMQLLWLADQSSAPIEMYIDSPGGSVYAGLSIVDTMQKINAPVHTIVHGMAASMGSILLVSGEKGFRFMTEHSQVMIHEVRGGNQGTYTEQLDNIRQTRFLNDITLCAILAEGTGRTMEEMRKYMNTGDRWLYANHVLPQESNNYTGLAPMTAIQFGIVDAILPSTKPKRGLAKLLEDGSYTLPNEFTPV